MRRRAFFLPRSLLRLLLLLAAATAAAGGATDHGNNEQGSRAQLTHLFPETPLHAQRQPCGATRRFRLHALAPDKVYDLKVSYPASLPTTFALEVARVAADGDRTEESDRADGDAVRVRRRLNTAKLRLRPSELLLLLARQQRDTQDEIVNAYRLALPKDGTDNDDSDSDSRRQPTPVAVDVVLRADVEGVSPFVDPRTRECVFDIVVEEMLLGGAFPFNTLVLIAWLLLLLAAALKWVFPFLLRKIALELPAERAVFVSGSGADSDRKES
ncbi:hypothetical protein PybrP1_011180 [[Pythium] brassicae (nom. inval.)]|nr:hypothetical protein PybrP1_011180 [[Pythium] brassicae (nom. inval.)]